MKTLSKRLKAQRSVPDPIASDTWTFKDSNGRKRTARIEVGRPQQLPEDPNGDWFCPVFIEGWTPNVIPAMGVGPVDSLMNAIIVVRGFLEHIGSFNVTMGAKNKRRRAVARRRRRHS